MAERNTFSKEKLSQFFDILKKNCPQKPSDYYILKKYALFENEFLVDKKDLVANRIPPIYISTDQVEKYLKLAHDRVFHGGIKKTYRACKLEAKNIKMKQVINFIAKCTYCQKTKNTRGYKKLRPNVTRPIISREYGSRGQADLIDVRVFEQKQCSFILNYQDNLTRFCVLKPLKDKSAESISPALTEIFNLLGAPKCLHTDNGGEFRSKKLIGVLKKFWPSLTLIRGMPYNPRSQGAVERCNQDVKNMLMVYIDQKTDGNYDFVNALSFIQFSKNIAFHRSIKCSPYRALFGQDPATELKSEHSLNFTTFDSLSCTDESELSERQESIRYSRNNTFDSAVVAAQKMML